MGSSDASAVTTTSPATTVNSDDDDDDSTSGDDDVSDDNDDNGNESNDDDNADSDASVESASGDSEDANSANGNDKATLNGLLSGEGMENGEDEGTEMNVSFTKATYLNMWGIFAMLLVLNALCCLMCFKKKSVDAIEVDDRASFV